MNGPDGLGPRMALNIARPSTDPRMARYGPEQRVFLTYLSWGRWRPRPEGGLYRRLGLTCLEIHSAVSRDLVSVATPVMCEKEVS